MRDIRPIAGGVAATMLLALVLRPAATADAHALAPSLLAIYERAPGVADVEWKIPLLRMSGADLRPILPAACAVTTPEQVSSDEESITTRWSVACGGGLLGALVSIDGLSAAKSDALLHIELADGRMLDTVLRPRDASFTVPARERRLEVARRYVELGVDHILTGYDHLLFVFGLLLLASTMRALAATITTFTVGHSLTLTLAVLGVTRIPPAPVEVLIALSIFTLAVELARAPDTPTLMRRAPWMMALAFGFLHGLGFAGTLRATGLPAGAIPLALLCFNVGIELGQLAFVLAVLALMALVRPVTVRLPRWSHAVPVYGMGTLAAFWMLERALPLLR